MFHPDETFDGTSAAVSGAPTEIGRKLRARSAGFAARRTPMLYDETGDAEAVREVIAER